MWDSTFCAILKYKYLANTVRAQIFKPSLSILAVPHSRGIGIFSLSQVVLVFSDVFLGSVLGGKSGILIHAAIVMFCVFIQCFQHLTFLVF